MHKLRYYAFNIVLSITVHWNINNIRCYIETLKSLCLAVVLRDKM